MAHEIVQNESRDKGTFLITENSQTKINENKISLFFFPGNDRKECYQRLSRDIRSGVD